jgi:hypothetical protein
MMFLKKKKKKGMTSKTRKQDTLGSLVDLLRFALVVFSVSLPFWPKMSYERLSTLE